MAGKRWCWVVLLMAALLVATAWSRQDPHRHWLRVNGTDWRRMDPDARLAYIEGFLAGAALSQAAAKAQDSVGVRLAMERLTRQGGFRFPYGANVYASRISDYYWWENHVPLPTWYAFLEVNATLGRPISDTVP
jgi:hypothetical protein